MHKNYLGDPGVIITHKTIMPAPVSYNFVTSIIVQTERGHPDIPLLINSIQEYDYYFGSIENDSRRHVLSFLQYSPSLMVQRSVKSNLPTTVPSDPGTYNASSTSLTTPYNRIRVDNLDEFNDLNTEIFLNDNKTRAIARTPGLLGNNLKVAIFNIQQFQNNVLVHSNNTTEYYAKNLVQEFDELYYCVVVFDSDIPVEVFLVPFDNVEKINEVSNEIYLAMYYDPEINGLHDGNIQFFDGNFGFYDGNVFNTLIQSFTFFGNDILELSGGEALQPDYNDLLESTEVINSDFFEIDLHIAWNIPLNRPDIVNIVPTPKGINQAKDSVEVYNLLNNNSTPKMFIYGIKKLDKKEMGLAADYAGLRSRTVLTEGLGVSSSKLVKPLVLDRLLTYPSINEMDELYYDKINPVHKYKGVYYCNGELLS